MPRCWWHLNQRTGPHSLSSVQADGAACGLHLLPPPDVHKQGCKVNCVCVCECLRCEIKGAACRLHPLPPPDKHMQGLGVLIV